MKRIFLLILLVFSALKGYCQTDTTYARYSPLDSSYSTVTDTIPDSTAEQKIDHIFENLDMSGVTSGVLIDRTIKLTCVTYFSIR